MARRWDLNLVRLVLMGCVSWAGCLYDYSALTGRDGGTGTNVLTGTGGIGRGSGGRLGSGGVSAGTGGAPGSGGATVSPDAGPTATGGTQPQGEGGHDEPGDGGTPDVAAGDKGGAPSPVDAGAGGVDAMIRISTGGVQGNGGGGAGGKGGGAGSGATGGAVMMTDPDLVLWYKFDESSGTIAADSSGFTGGPRNATLSTSGTGGAISFSTNHQVGTHAVSLTGNNNTGGGVVLLPSLYTLAPGEITLAAWVYIRSDMYWQRVFDIGTGKTAQMFLATQEVKDSLKRVRFAITTSGGNPEEDIDSAQPLPLNSWHHIVITLKPGSIFTGTMYIDGAVSGVNNLMTLHAGSLGNTTQNFIGKSQYTDPYLTGEIDDFRVYRRALSAAEVKTLFAVR